MSDMQKHLLPEWRREIARLQTENEALSARVARLKWTVREAESWMREAESCLTVANVSDGCEMALVKLRVALAYIDERAKG